MPEFSLTLSLERSGSTPDLAEIMETVELGTFETEDEARECLQAILDAAEIEVEDE